MRYFERMLHKTKPNVSDECCMLLQNFLTEKHQLLPENISTFILTHHLSAFEELTRKYFRVFKKCIYDN
jgi:hypothetical protein